MGCVIFPKLDSKTENVTFFGMGLFVIKNKSLFQIVFCFEKTFKSWIQDQLMVRVPIQTGQCAFNYHGPQNSKVKKHLTDLHLNADNFTALFITAGGKTKILLSRVIESVRLSIDLKGHSSFSDQIYIVLLQGSLQFVQIKID